MKINKAKDKTIKKVPARRFWKILFVFAVAFFVFGLNSKQASAGACYCHVLVEKTDGSGFEWQDKQLGDVATEKECADNCDGNDNSTDYNFVKSDGTSTGMTPVARPGQGSLQTCSVTKEDYGFFGDMFMSVLKALIYALFQLIVWILGAVTILFGWIVKSENMSLIMTNSGIYQSWAMVRDFLNLGFILVLLYIAFCVIFQIGSYSDSWKKMLLMMVIMALLVNFSFPICRVIIDFSNVAFYFLLNSGIGEKASGEGIMTFIIKQTGLQDLITVGLNCVSVSYLIAMTVFMFILTITLLVIAVLFVVRMVALGLLIIFSPIGFAGAAFPFSKKYASEWWDNLFKYAFFAPIMMFMILIAYKILSFMTRGSFNTLAENSLGAKSDIDPTFLGTMAFFAIPITILWYGMHMAQNMSIAGASAVTGTASKFAKWAGAKVTGIDAMKRGWGAYSARRKQADEDKWAGRLGRWAGSQQDRLRGALPGGRDAYLRYERDVAARVKRETERNDTVNMDEVSLKKLAQSGDKFEKAAAVMELASRGVADRNHLNDVRKNFGEDSQIAKQIQNKMKTYDPATAFTNMAGTLQRTKLDEFVKSNQFDAKKIKANSWKNQEFMESALLNGGVNSKQMEDVLKNNSKTDSDAIKTTLTAVADSNIAPRAGVDMDAIKALHMINFSQTGKLSPHGDSFDIQNHVFSRLDGESGANIDAATAASYAPEILGNIKPGKLIDMARNMKDVQAQKAILAEIKRRANNPAHPKNAIYRKHAQSIMRDASLSGAYAAA